MMRISWQGAGTSFPISQNLLAQAGARIFQKNSIACCKKAGALQSVLASLIVGVSNATNDCLSLAARVPPQELQHRDVNLRHAFKGAAVVTQLVDAFERVRGNRPGNLNVGKVNVESGGQAIVGTVQSGRRDQEPGATTASERPKTPRRK